MLNVVGRLIVVVGGGQVAARKVAGLVRAGANHVRVVAPELRGDFPDDISDHVEHVAEMYHPANLDDAALVFAATDERRVNDAVVRDAHERGLFVCRADNDEESPGDFITPAAFSDGPVHVSVSAGSAALSAAIRDGIKSTWRDSWTQMANFMQQQRPMLTAMKGLTIEQRRAIFRTLASEAAFDALDSGGSEALSQWLELKHPELSHV